MQDSDDFPEVSWNGLDSGLKAVQQGHASLTAPSVFIAGFITDLLGNHVLREQGVGQGRETVADEAEQEATLTGEGLDS